MCYKTPTQHTHAHTKTSQMCLATPSKQHKMCAFLTPPRSNPKTSLIGPKSSAKNETFFLFLFFCHFPSYFSPILALYIYKICPLFRLENMILKQIMAIENWLMRLIGRKQLPKAAVAAAAAFGFFPFSCYFLCSRFVFPFCSLPPKKI